MSMTASTNPTITWLGHAATRIDSPDGRVILIDPFIAGNPVTPEDKKSVERVDIMLITHGHGDNMGDAVSLGKRFNPYTVCQNELAAYLGTKGVENTHGGNTGGTQDIDGIRVTMVDAIHSSSVEEDGRPVYVGLAVGFVIRFPDGYTIYFAGDTAVFEGMKLIGRLYRPDIALLPIGDYYTMGPEEAAEAIRLLGVKHVIPVHFGTFPVLTGTADALKQAAADIAGLQIHVLKPGDSVDTSRFS
jgi:L-ascorbate metabolism protein UlaG (beta-lactamase superfamily)